VITSVPASKTLRGRIRALAGLLALALVCCAVPAQAQISIEQLELRFAANSGAAALAPQSFRINNVSDAPVQVTIRLADWDRSITGENRYYEPGSQPSSCAAALAVFPMTLRIEQGRAEDVRVSVDSNAASPCHSLLFVEMPPPPATVTKGANMTYNLRYGIKVYVEPELAPAGEIVEASVTTAQTDSGRADTLHAIFRNTGLVQAIARGYVEVRREDDSVVSRVPVADFPVLGGAVRKLPVALPALSAGRYAVILFLDLGTDELLAAQALLDIP
jgi:P pilus assembly chaperone PapD